MLGPLLFNVFLCDPLLEDKNNYFANYVDYSTSYFVGSTTAEVLEIYLASSKNCFLGLQTIK